MILIIFLQKVYSCIWIYAVTILYVHWSRSISTCSNSDFYWYWIAVKFGYFLIATIERWCFNELALNSAIIAIFAAFTCVVEFTMLSVTYSILMLYVSTLIGSFSTLLYATCQSFTSCLFLENDRRKAYSLNFCFESFANTVGPILYIGIYKILQRHCFHCHCCYVYIYHARNSVYQICR